MSAHLIYLLFPLIPLALFLWEITGYMDKNLAELGVVLHPNQSESRGGDYE